MSKQLNKNEINEIEIKYHFDEGFLLAKIEELPTEISLFKNYIENSSRLSTIKKHISKLEQIARKLNEALIKTSAQTKIFINEAKALKMKNDNWSISQFYADSQDFYNKCLFAIAKLPKDTGGRKNDSIPKYIIFKFASIYEKSTKIEPVCGWDDLNDSHIGQFYEFVLALRPILKVLGINLGTDKTIGTYCIEVLANCKNVLEKL